MSSRLILIRHGQSEDNVAGRLSGATDSDLTPVGVQQAERMARFVADRYRLAALYTSPLTRARRTAEPLARLIDLPLILVDDLREIHFGIVDGLPFSEIAERFPDEWSRGNDDEDVTFGFPGGETRAQFYARVWRTFQQLADRHDGQEIAVVSHGGVLSSFLAWIAEGKPQRWRRYLKDNCSVSEVVADAGQFSIVCWNVLDHLDGIHTVDRL